MHKRTLLREPLLHFLLLGAGLFVAYHCLNRGLVDVDPQTIVVDRDRLLTFVQYRSRAFDKGQSNKLIDALSEDELASLIEDYAREEVLYREAKALQLDRNDYLARLRLIQQMEFIIRGFSDTQLQLTDQQIRRYYEAHKSEYWVEPKLTFAHVFFNRELHGARKAQTLARTELGKLNQTTVRFEQATAHGERFLYHTNYVGRGREEIASHFGSEFQRRLFALEPNERVWRGPLESSHGVHLVLLTHRDVGYLPSFDAVRDKVGQDAREAALETRFEESVKSLERAYKVNVKRREFVALKGVQDVTEEGEDSSG